MTNNWSGFCGNDSNTVNATPGWTADDGTVDGSEPEDFKVTTSGNLDGTGRYGGDIGAWTSGVTQIGYSGDSMASGAKSTVQQATTGASFTVSPNGAAVE